MGNHCLKFSGTRRYAVAMVTTSLFFHHNSILSIDQEGRTDQDKTFPRHFDITLIRAKRLRSSAVKNGTVGEFEGTPRSHAQEAKIKKKP